MNTIETDTFIATHIMRWQTVTSIKISGAFWDPETKRTKQVLGGEMHAQRLLQHITHGRPVSERDKAGDGFTFSPSTNEVDAIGTLKKLAGLGYTVGISIKPHESGVFIFRDDTGNVMCCAYAKDIPSALLQAMQTFPTDFPQITEH